MLCPVEYTEQDFVEPPKITHRKKNEKDRERERLEREKSQKIADYFRKKQEDANKPVNPREPLKRTANNNWVHVTCAVFTPEVKFGNSKALEPSEGIPSIGFLKWDEICQVCKHKGGAVVLCPVCHKPGNSSHFVFNYRHLLTFAVHVECAHQADYTLGFDITPVKGSRRDHTNVVTINGETGTMAAVIWCKEHTPTKTIVHPMHQIVDGTELNALQLFVQNFKQADLTLTGTVRKANLVSQSTKINNPVVVAASTNRRTSTTTNNRSSISHVKVEETSLDGKSCTKDADAEKVCITCSTDVSPKWWALSPSPSQPVKVPESSTPVNGEHPFNGDHGGMDGQPSENGLAPNSEDGVGYEALAVAALHRDPPSRIPTPLPTEYQCHKCHCRKVVPKEPTLSPVPPSPQRESSRLLTPDRSSIDVPMPDADIAQPAPQYAWPQPPSYSGNINGAYNSWPNRSPTLPDAAVHRLNGSHSPSVISGPSQTSYLPNGQAQMRQPSVPRSPLQNGAPNGYPHTHSPRRSLSSSGIHIQNSSYPSYSSTMPLPQHLTNGGPPPRAPEHPFHHSDPHSAFSPPYASPPMRRDSFQDSNEQTQAQDRDFYREPSEQSHSQARDIGSQNGGGRSYDGRVNGGASASPSLRNLLS
jgi:hypothetical protein